MDNYKSNDLKKKTTSYIYKKKKEKSIDIHLKKKELKISVLISSNYASTK